VFLVVGCYTHYNMVIRRGEFNEWLVGHFLSYDPRDGTDTVPQSQGELALLNKKTTPKRGPPVQLAQGCRVWLI